MNRRPSKSIISMSPVVCSVRRRFPWTIIVEVCGAVTCRALLLNTPSDLVTPTNAPPVTLVCCVYLKSARLVPTAKIATAETYELITKAFAQLLGAVVIVVNRVGFEDGLCFWGGSMAVGPDGRIIAQAPMLDESLTIAAFDPAELRRQRMITPLARDERLLLTIEELNRIKRRSYE